MLVTLHTTITTGAEACALLAGRGAHLPQIRVLGPHDDSAMERGVLVAPAVLLRRRAWFRRGDGRTWPLTKKWLMIDWRGEPLRLFTAELEIPPETVAWGQPW